MSRRAGASSGGLARLAPPQAATPVPHSVQNRLPALKLAPHPAQAPPAASRWPQLEQNTASVSGRVLIGVIGEASMTFACIFIMTRLCSQW